MQLERLCCASIHRVESTFQMSLFAPEQKEPDLETVDAHTFGQSEFDFSDSKREVMTWLQGRSKLNNGRLCVADCVSFDPLGTKELCELF